MPATIADQDRNGGEAIHVEGYNGHDLIFGSAFADCIKTGEPEFGNNSDNDWVLAGDGDDFIEGKAGSDHLWGDAGDDVIFGFYADLSDPLAQANDADDFIYGGAGDDKRHDSWCNDELDGGPGVDSFFLDADGESDKVIDEIIRGPNGLGDFNGDGEIDRNWMDYSANVGNVTVEFDHDYTSGVEVVIYTIDRTGEPASPIGTVNNRPDDARYLLVETIDAMFDAVEAFANGGQYLAQWDFFDNGENELVGFDGQADAPTSDAMEFIHEIVGTRLGDAVENLLTTER
jgi:hypothetical protein